MKNRNLINEVTRIQEMMGVKLITEKVLDYFIKPLIKAGEKGIESAEIKSLRSAIESSLDDVLKAVDNPLTKKMETAGIRTIDDLAKIGEKGLTKAEVKKIEQYMADNIIKKLETTGQSNIIDRIKLDVFDSTPQFNKFKDKVTSTSDAWGNGQLIDDEIELAKAEVKNLQRMKIELSKSGLNENEMRLLNSEIDDAIVKIEKNIAESGGSLEKAAEDAATGAIEDEVTGTIPNEGEIGIIIEELSTSELVTKKIDNMTSGELKEAALEWFNKLKNKDINKLTQEEMAWFIQLSEKGQFTSDQLKLLTLDSPSIKETADLMKMWQEYDKKYANFREQQTLPSFEKFLNSKGFKKPVGFNKFMGGSLKFVKDLGKHWYYCATNLGDMGTKQWWKSFMNVCMHGAILFTGTLPFIYKTGGRVADKVVKKLNDLTPLSPEQITEKFNEFLNYSDPKIDGISIYGTKDATTNSKFRQTPPTVTVLSAKEGTIEVNPGISVDGKVYTTFKFTPNDAVIGSGNENVLPHTMETIKGTPVTPVTPVTPAPVTGGQPLTESEASTFLTGKGFKTTNFKTTQKDANTVVVEFKLSNGTTTTSTLTKENGDIKVK